MTTDNQTMAGSDVKEGKVSLETLSKMTGFPVELIKDEVFNGDVSSQVSLEELRAAMLSYIDSTMLISDEK